MRRWNVQRIAMAGWRNEEEINLTYLFAQDFACQSTCNFSFSFYTPFSLTLQFSRLEMSLNIWPFPKVAHLIWENEREKEIPNVLLVNYEISWIARGFQILNKENVTIAMFHSPILAKNANSISLGIAFIFHHHFYGFRMHSMENIA